MPTISYATIAIALQLLITVLATVVPALAQHTHGEVSVPPQHPSPAGDAELFPPREVSGTAWLPDLTPTFGVHRPWRGWEVVLHGNGFAQFLYEPGERHRTGGFSTRQLGSVNW